VKETISTKLANRLSYLEPEQLDNLIKQAQHLKKRSNDPASNLDVWIERALKRESRVLESAADQRSATVISVLGQDIIVEAGNETIKVKQGNSTVIVGDKVTIGTVGSDTAIIGVKTRTTKLSRPDVDNPNIERLIVANVDIVGIVVSVVSPPLHPRLIDRYLVAIQNGGAKPIICVNKIDLLNDPEELDLLNPYRAIGIPVVHCSTRDGQGLDELKALVQGQIVAFVGHSGVGKSSLINAFAPSLNLDTGSLMEGYGRGAHTTTVSSLHRLEGGTILVDTPGIRSFGISGASKEDVERSFPEFADLQCRYRNCTHTAEPGCGIIEAVEAGQVSGDRYDTFLRLREESS